jgi:AraC-like DNA-binding protein
MKSQFIQRLVDVNSSLAVQDYSSESFLKVWHYHPELELNVIRESTGTAFVGDSIEKFEPGDVVLVGKNLPHLWLNEEIYFEKDSNLLTKAHIIHFFEDFAGGLFQIPEMIEISKLIERAKLGIKFVGTENNIVTDKIALMIQCSGYERIMLFIEVLKLLSVHRNYRILSSLGYTESISGVNKDKLLPVYEFVINNFKSDINLETVADLANMNTSSFSRYFTSIHKKTFTKFLNEIRIGCACKLLIRNRHIASACYESGFNNISNFNRQFKAIKKLTPSDYIRLHSIV